jgi:uncharacterized membrane protein (UPF0127 family)
MNLTRWIPLGILDGLTRRLPAKPDASLRISNLTREMELARRIEVADHGAKRRKGLLGRDRLPAGEGLWIVPCEAVHTFGMRFAIDLVYMDRNLRVKKVKSNVPPWRLSACLTAHSVLELSPGTITRTQTKPGDILEFSAASPLIETRSGRDAFGPALRNPDRTRDIEMSMYRNKLRAIAEFLVVAICTLGFTLTLPGVLGSLIGHNAAGTRDFVEYWAAGRQLVHHANPYDGEALLRLERSVGFPSDLTAQIMANPPWVLPLVLPLGLLSPRIGVLLWSALLLASLVASVRMVWVMHGRPKTQLNFLGYTFAPALSCLLLGQVSIFLLLGLVLFLRLHRSRPFLAGISLWLCMLKPHLFLPFGTVLLVWVITTKAYRVLAGTAATLAVNTAAAFVMDHHIWTHYRQMMLSTRVDQLPIPCFSIMLRLHLWPHTLWLQYLPAVLGCIWALAYFRKYRDSWDWLAHGSLLMLVSVLVPPYTWFMDQVVVIPALLHGAYATRSRVLVALLALASAVIEIQGLLGASALRSALFLWTTPAWILWYLCATKPHYATNVYDLLPPTHGILVTAAKD